MGVTTINGSTQIRAASIPAANVDSTIIVAGGGNAFTADQSMGSHKLTNVATPSAGTDAANKSYVDAATQGLSQKPTARVATTAALPSCTYANGASGVGATLTALANAVLTVDGIATALNDLILVKNQASAFQNGLYTVTTAGAVGAAFVLTRHTSMDAATEFNGALVPVDNEGTTNANTMWLCNNVEAGVTVGTTNITFTDIAGAGANTAGNGISISGTTISTNNGNGIGYSGATLIVVADATGGSNLAKAINVSANGVAVKVDGTTIAGNGSNQLGIVAGGVGPTQLAAQATGTGLQGGNGTSLSIQISPREVPSGTINGSNTAFTLAHTPVSGTEHVFLNGVLAKAGAGNAYTISGTVITMLTAPASGDDLAVTYFF